MRVLTASVVAVVSMSLCACSGIPKGYPSKTVEVSLNDTSGVTYQGIDLGPNTILGQDGPYPTRMVGPLFVVTSPKGTTRYCGHGQVRRAAVLIDMCFSMAELREMKVTSYRTVRLAKAEPNRVVRMARAEPSPFQR